MHTHTIAEHGENLRKKSYSSVELTQHFIDRITADTSLNAFITVAADVALQQAKAADQLLAKGQASPLTGIPIAHKDLFCTDGVLTTCGSKILHNFVAPYDATVVEKLAASGMVMLGKTNMDEFAMGASTETSYYGATCNPWDTTRVPGGSSGGSAAAVAARLVPVATATDTGGSIRQPAAWCGLSGIKPSYGRVSRYGMIAFASSLDQAGVLANNIADAALVLHAISGFDPRDSTSLPQSPPDYAAAVTEATGQTVRGKTIGLPKQFFTSGVDPAVASAIEAAIAVLTKLGARTVEVDLPNSEVGIPCYYVLAPAEASANLARYDGVRFGHRAEQYVDLMDMYEKTRAEGFGEEVKRRILLGTYVLSAGYYDAYYVKAQKLRRLIAQDFQHAFTKCDFIAGPTTPTTAFAFGAKNDDPIAMYLNDIFTNSANLAGLPALSVAAGFDHSGLPLGLHLIGRYLDESTLLAVAHEFQQHTDWHTRIAEGWQ